MQTVQMKCGNCHNIMAIHVDHLGSRVHCPHCQTIVQTPDRSAFHLPPLPTSAVSPPAAQEPIPEPPPSEGLPKFNVGDRDSIFGSTEAVDDLFADEGAAPKLEIPKPEPIPASQEVELGVEPTKTIGENLDRMDHPPSNEGIAPFGGSPTTPHRGSLAAEMAASAAQSDLSAIPQQRPRPKQGNASMILLIFLVPYAIMTTGYIAYLLYNFHNAGGNNALELFPDSDPKGGGAPRRVKHDLPLPAKLRTTFNQSLRIGDIEFTPEKIQATRDGNLVLVAKFKNLSTNQSFRPISDSFLRVADGKGMRTGDMPYTFLEGKSTPRIYGGTLELAEDAAHEGIPNVELTLGPGQSGMLRLVTRQTQSVKTQVQAVLASTDTLVWRLQVRRGMVTVRGRDHSACAVVGVVFTARDVQRL